MDSIPFTDDRLSDSCPEYDCPQWTSLPAQDSQRGIDSCLPERSSQLRALQQIEKQQYIAEFKQKQIPSVLKYGISFCGKKTYVTM